MEALVQDPYLLGLPETLVRARMSQDIDRGSVSVITFC